jgi:hypothetical protein
MGGSSLSNQALMPERLTYLALGIRMEPKAARYSASPMGGSSPSDHPDLPGNRHEDGAKGGVLSFSNGTVQASDYPAKGGQIPSISHGRDPCPGPPILTWQWA